MTRFPAKQKKAVLLGGPGLLVVLLLVLGLGFVGQSALAQIPAPRDSAETASQTIHFDAWEQLADQTDAQLLDPATTSQTLEQLRAQVAGWREVFLGAQNANSARIATLREQIAALGPVPADGETEAEEIASRRAALNDQLVTLQAPGLAADEAYRRADGLIREIDRALRDRQADELLRLMPSPANPANWGEGWQVLSAATAKMMREVSIRWTQPTARAQLLDRLPVILLLILTGLGLLWRGRPLVEAGVSHLVQRSSARGIRVSALILSLGQIVIPTLGAVAFAQAMKLSGMLGIVGTSLADFLPVAAFLVFALHWLGGQLFPKDRIRHGLPLSEERRAEGRFLSSLLGLVLGAEALGRGLVEHENPGEAAEAVLAFPFLVATAILLWRAGRLLVAAASVEGDKEESGDFRARVLRILGRAVMIIGVVGPLLAVIGYIPAAAALISPAATSLGLIGVLYILQRLVVDIYAILTRSEEEATKALVPVLIGFGLALASLPLFALVWGARVSDLTEVWTRLREGFQIGESRISPTDFLVFALVFAFGFMLTRLFQGALKGSVLPRTKLDQGARNAIVSGTGYIGIFLASLIAINTAGLDLSGLAIVAGALSVGIGFGLQNIVSNFVSGIILLIERPVSEGDWIEVGGVQGVVKSISVRSTRIQTFDRNDVIVPNTDLVAGQVTNWTRFNLSGRLIVPVGVAYGSDTRRVEKVLREIAEAQPLVLLNPPPSVLFMGFGADSLNFEIRAILRDVNFSLSTRSEINHQIAERFAQEGIEVPFAQRDINLRNADEVARAFRGEPSDARTPTSVTPGSVPVTGRMEQDHVPGEGLDPGDPDSDGTGGGP